MERRDGCGGLSQELHGASARAQRVNVSKPAGIIGQTERQLGQFRADLVHLDATLRLFARELEPKTIPAKRIRQADLWFEQGELPRRVLDALRRAGEPIRAPDIVRAVMSTKVSTLPIANASRAFSGRSETL